MKLYRIGTHKKTLIFSKNNKNEEIYPNKEKLMQIKCEIDKCPQKEWDKSKKNTNEYEYIYTSANRKKNLCSVIPVSRSYFKLHEMIINFNLPLYSKYTDDVSNFQDTVHLSRKGAEIFSLEFASQIDSLL